MSASAAKSWHDIAPADALDIDCTKRPDLSPPVNENGDVCPWPWEPQQLAGAPLGQMHCSYCGAMAMAGLPHPDWSDYDEMCAAEGRAVMTYARDPYDTPEPPCFCDREAGTVLTTEEFCPAHGDPGKPAPEPPDPHDAA